MPALLLGIRTASAWDGESTHQCDYLEFEDGQLANKHKNKSDHKIRCFTHPVIPELMQFSFVGSHKHLIGSHEHQCSHHSTVQAQVQVSLVPHLLHSSVAICSDMLVKYLPVGEESLYKSHMQVPTDWRRNVSDGADVALHTLPPIQDRSLGPN